MREKENTGQEKQVEQNIESQEDTELTNKNEEVEQSFYVDENDVVEKEVRDAGLDIY